MCTSSVRPLFCCNLIFCSYTCQVFIPLLSWPFLPTVMFLSALQTGRTVQPGVAGAVKHRGPLPGAHREHHETRKGDFCPVLGQPWWGLPLAIGQWTHIKTLLVCAACNLHGQTQPGDCMVNVKDHFVFPQRNRFRSHFPCWSFSWLSSLVRNSSLCHRAQGQVTSDAGLGRGTQ